ncbi:MAG: glycosyltransferase family 9 protein, partial [Fusobacteriaceae bacterium]
TKFIGLESYRYKKRSLWKTILVKMKAIRYSADNTIVKNYFGAFEKFQINYNGEDIEFPFLESDLKNINKDYYNLPIIAPGASKNTKKWLPEEFGKLAKLFYEKWGVRTVVIGGPEDSGRAEIINESSGGVTINLTGKLSLKESGALLSKGKFLVTNDSGPFHIGRGVGCKTFVIFGPTDPGMFELGDKDTLIYREETCSPCSLHGDKECPKKHFNCMRKLKAENVMAIIEKIGG